MLLQYSIQNLNTQYCNTDSVDQNVCPSFQRRICKRVIALLSFICCYGSWDISDLSDEPIHTDLVLHSYSDLIKLHEDFEVLS